MRYILSLILANLLFWQPAFAVLYNSDKALIWNKNLLTNGGFESGTSSWTASAGTFATTTTAPMIGSVHATWDAAASADTLVSTAVTIPAGMYGRNAVASCLFTTASGTATHEIQAYDGSNVLSEVTITSSTTPARASANFIMPSSGSISVRIYANADEPSIAIDDCYVGPSEGYNTSSVSQAIFIGSAYFATTTNCIFTRTNTALGVLGDSDCPGPTVELNPGPGTIQTTDTDNLLVTVNNLPPGRYRVVFTGAMTAGSGAVTAFAINDGTNTYGQTSSGTASASRTAFSVEATFEYSSAGNRTYTLYGSAASGTITVNNEASNARTNFAIYRFPLSSEQAYTPDLMAMSWSGYHDSTCSFARTNTALGLPADDATCSLTTVTSQNMTVSSVGNVSPAITFTPKKAGRYFACASFIATTSSVYPSVALLDGSTVIDYQSSRNAASQYSSYKLCGVVVATSTAAKTVSVYTAATSGAVTISDPVAITGGASINWSIFSIDQSLPAPVLTGSMVTNNSGIYKTIAADLNCDSGSAITSQSGTTSDGIASIGNISAGACAITIASGTFSAAPYCILTPTIGDGAGDTLGLGFTGTPTSTAATVDCHINSSTDCTSYNFHMICMGPR